MGGWSGCPDLSQRLKPHRFRPISEAISEAKAASIQNLSGGYKARFVAGLEMSGLKPGSISEAKTTTKARRGDVFQQVLTQHVPYRNESEGQVGRRHRLRPPAPALAAERSTGLGQQDDEFHLRVAQLGRGVYREVAGAFHRFPRGAAALQAEVLVAQLHRDGARRRFHVGHADAGKRLPDQRFNVRRGACLGQLGDAVDDVGIAHVGRDGEVKA